MKLIAYIVAGVFIAISALYFFHWTINRVYVPPNHSLMLRYKGPLVFGKGEKAKSGHFAEPGQVGVLRDMPGPGRHFYCPIWWEREVVKDQIVMPGEVAIVRSMLGDDLPEDQFLVDGQLGETAHKGILRKVYGPGRYRVNPYGYEFKIVKTQTHQSGEQIKHSGWVSIPTGYVGVVTNLAPNPATGAAVGIQPNVLPPGIYPINSREQQVDIIEVGYREVTIVMDAARNPDGSLKLDETGEPVIDVELSGGINFPSNDGFPIHMDFTAIWGVMPDAAPQVIRTFGDIEAVEDKVVLPQIESICRNNGSSYAAVEMLVGEDRQKFQLATGESLEAVLESKQLSLLYGLVRHIYIPQQVRKPIQAAFIAEELKLTRNQEQMTAQERAKLREAEQKVEFEAEKVNAETEKMVAEAMAEGRKQVGEIGAETEKLVAAIDRQVAEIEAQATVALGEASAKAEQLKQEAAANKFTLAVQAFKTPEAYNRWVFASNLPPDVKLNLIYAGQGTFWTDLKGFSETMIGRQFNEQQQIKRK